jgi:hypothetical protein
MAPKAEGHDIIQRYEDTYKHGILAYNRQIYETAGIRIGEPYEYAMNVLYDPHVAAAAPDRPDNSRLFARKIRSSAINRYMGSIHRWLVDTSEAPPWSSYRLRALYNYAYWHLADMAENRRLRMRRCAGCGGWFEQQDNRQRFCPPGPGQIGSRCAARERMRAKRRRAT